VTVRANRLRPGPAAEAWLSQAVAELKGADPLGPLTVVVPNQYAKLALRRRLAAAGYANVRHEVLTRVAESLGASELAAQGKVPLTAVTEEAAIRAALRAAGGLGAQTEHRAVISTLQALFRDLAEVGLDGEKHGRLASRGELAPLRGRLRVLALLGAVQVAGPFLLISAGEGAISSSLAGILVATAPIFTALLALRIDRDERSEGTRLAGVGIGIVGVVALFGLDLTGSGSAVLGGLAVVLAGAGYAVLYANPRGSSGAGEESRRGRPTGDG